jgi:multidrug efflux pump subunit AcrA (membrane-fusion protein)
LLVEVDAQNPNGQLLPGAYAFVHFELGPQDRAVTIPSNALLFRQEGPQVGVVRNGKAVLVGIKIGRDYGDRLEVLSGLTGADAVILDPSDSLTNGSPVHSERASQ